MLLPICCFCSPSCFAWHQAISSRLAFQVTSLMPFTARLKPTRAAPHHADDPVFLSSSFAPEAPGIALHALPVTNYLSSRNGYSETSSMPLCGPCHHDVRLTLAPDRNQILLLQIPDSFDKRCTYVTQGRCDKRLLHIPCLGFYAV